MGVGIALVTVFVGGPLGTGGVTVLVGEPGGVALVTVFVGGPLGTGGVTVLVGEPLGTGGVALVTVLVGEQLGTLLAGDAIALATVFTTTTADAGGL